MTMHDILALMRERVGDDWAEKLAAEMTAPEAQALREALERKTGGAGDDE